MDAVAYVSILEKTLLPMIEKLHPNGHRFVQDNDPKHTSARVQQFFIGRGSIDGIPCLSHQIATQLRIYGMS